jgi:hypothetical protein
VQVIGFLWAEFGAVCKCLWEEFAGGYSEGCW